MKAFQCDSCGNLLFFENVTCLRCQHPLGFLPEPLDLCALEKAEADLWRALGKNARDRRYRQCKNSIDHQICNWLVPDHEESPFCRACRLNLIIPDLSVNGNQRRWYKLEVAKRRVLYSLLRLNLPTGQEGEKPALRFNFMANPADGSAILTGHNHGIITINIAEADDAERERRRTSLREPIRTLIAHFRHELGHYYWDRLIAGTSHLERFHELFGDEQVNYPACLESHYASGPPPNWQENFVSAYASCHPWEDWAETWAHYLHITDTIETAASFGLSLRPRHPQSATMRAEPTKVSEKAPAFDELMQAWVPMTQALNELSRGMGLNDFYPFVVAQNASQKIRFVHELLTKSWHNAGAALSCKNQQRC